MKQYQSFIFESAGFDEEAHSIRLQYSLDGEVSFTEQLILPKTVSLKHINRPDVQQALRALHIIGGVSYFKTCLPPTIAFRYKDKELSASDAEFWNTVYTNGLGEFFYKNKIKPEGVVNFTSNDGVVGRESRDIKEADSAPNPRPKTQDPKLLVPIGGGKDSLVTIELLRTAGHNITLLRMGHHPYIDEMARVAGLPLISIDRKLDGKLFDLNEEGALNGHIPITAYLCCLSVVIALLTDHQYVALSNERSADEGNTTIGGFDVNHQWSKSTAFENLFNEYLHQHVSADITVFSMLRPLSEVQIAQQLVKHERYLPLFTSCNRNWHMKDKKKMQTRWCTQCPKCAFAFVLFAPFLDMSGLTQIFHHNLFNDAELLPLFRELLGVEGHKPFECVGTAKEVAAALYLAHETGDYEDTLAMKMFAADVLPSLKNPEEIVEECLTSASIESVPEPFKPIFAEL